MARYRHLASRTEQTYWYWVTRFLQHYRQRPELPDPAPGVPVSARGWRTPEALGTGKIPGFLTNLAVDRHVAAATQNQ